MDRRGGRGRHHTVRPDGALHRGRRRADRHRACSSSTKAICARPARTACTCSARTGCRDPAPGRIRAPTAPSRASSARWCVHAGWFPLEDAVRRMTAVPAQRFGLDDRGLVRPGDGCRPRCCSSRDIADRATFDDPTQLPQRHPPMCGWPVPGGGRGTRHRATCPAACWADQERKQAHDARRGSGNAGPRHRSRPGRAQSFQTAGLLRPARLCACGRTSRRTSCRLCAHRQVELGACGITCQKLGEAEVMADAGMDDILISYPLIGPGQGAAARRAGAIG